MGNARGALRDRGHDVYEMPAVAVEALLRVESLPHHVWEPACGPSQRIAEVLRAHDHQVTASDLTTDRIDFSMERRAPEGAGAIVTNPPYKLAADFVRHGLELVPLVIMLLRINFLEAQRRRDLIEGGKLARVHLFADRLPRMHREGWTGNRTSGSTAFAWFIWGRDHAGPIALDRIWAQPEKARRERS